LAVIALREALHEIRYFDAFLESPAAASQHIADIRSARGVSEYRALKIGDSQPMANGEGKDIDDFFNVGSNQMGAEYKIRFLVVNTLNP
jgi:hypothetical protein